MDRIIKFSILGFLFFLVISLFRENLYFSFDLFDSVAVAVVIAVGILKSPKIGLAFGFSSLPAYIVEGFLWGWFWWSRAPLYLFLLFVNSSIFAFYGYLPPKYYLKGRRTSRLIVVFLATLLLDFILSFSLSLVFLYPIDPRYFMDYLSYLLVCHLFSIVTTFVLGGISAGLTVRHIKSSAMQLRQPQVFSSTDTRAYSDSIRCTNCGYENPPGLEFCGKCGSPLPREDETRIY